MNNVAEQHDRNLHRNIFRSAAAQLISRPLWILFLLYSIKALGTEQMGVFVYVSILFSLISAFADFGVDTWAMKSASKEPDIGGNWVITGLYFKLTTFVIIGALSLSWLLFRGMPEYVNTALWYMPLAFLMHMNGFLRHLLRGSGRVYSEIKGTFIDKVATSVLGICLLFFFPDVRVFIGAYLIGQLACAGVFMRQLPAKPSGDNITIFNLAFLRDSLPYSFMNMILFTHTRAPAILLESISRSVQAVGVFGTGWRYVEAYTMIPQMVATPLFPYLSQTGTTSSNKQVALLDLLRLLTWASTAAAGILFCYREPLLSMLTGLLPGVERFQAALLVCIIVPVSLTYVMGVAVVAFDCTKRTNLYTLTLLFFYLPGLYLLIARFGTTGAVTGTLIGEFLYMFMLTLGIRNVLSVRKIFASWGIPFLVFLASVVLHELFSGYHPALQMLFPLLFAGAAYLNGAHSLVLNLFKNR
jgi:O-antigen/teichoic acid export membrane protein